MPPCAGPIKARPFGWPRRTRPALTGPARGGCEICGRDERMLAARVEPKNRRKFKPLILGQYQTAADIWHNIEANLSRQPLKASALEFLRLGTVIRRGTIIAVQ